MTDRVVEEGKLVGDPDRTIKIVTLNFVANGGDGYGVLGANPNQLQILATYEQALREYLQDLGTVSASDPRYAPGGEGRSVFLEPPSETPVDEAAGAATPPDAGTGHAPAERSRPVMLVLLILVGVAVLAVTGNRQRRRS